MTEAELSQIKLRHQGTPLWDAARDSPEDLTCDHDGEAWPCDAYLLLGHVEELEKELRAERAAHRVEMEGMRESNSALLDETRRLQGRIEELEKGLRGVLRWEKEQLKAEERGERQRRGDAVARRVDFVFDGPPGPEGPRFVEVEDVTGRGVSVGEWIDRGNGLWALRVKLITSGGAPAVVFDPPPEEDEPREGDPENWFE